MSTLFHSERYLALNREWSLLQIDSKNQLFDSRSGITVNITNDTLTFLSRCDGSTPFKELSRNVKPESLKKLREITKQLIQMNAIEVLIDKASEILSVDIIKYSGPELQDLMIHITGKCNSNCKHCYIKEQEISRELTPDEINEIIYTASELGVKRVHLTGGEPFLRDDLDSISENLRKRKICLRSIFTDGSMLSEQETLLEKIHTDHSPIFYISIDGLEENHDFFRENSGSFQKTLEGIKLLSKFGFGIVINTVLTNVNQNDILSLYKLLKDFQIVRWHLFNPFLIGKWKKNETEFGIKPTSNFNIYKKVLKVWTQDQKPFDLVLGNFFNSIGNRLLNHQYNQDSYACCDTYHSACTIWSNGDITPCGRVYEGYIIGNVVNNTLREIWENNLMRYYKELKIQDIITEKCHNCEYLIECGLGCRGNACERGFPYETPDPIVCKQFKSGNFNKFKLIPIS